MGRWSVFFSELKHRNVFKIGAACFGKYELAIEIWQGLPIGFAGVIWRPIIKPLRQMPGFKGLATKGGLVDY